MIKILFVCHGNICRSPMAEFVMKAMVEEAGCKEQFFIASAATSTEEIGNDIHYGTKEKLRENGIPFESRSARQMRKSDYEAYDYLIGMDNANIRNMKRICVNDTEHKMYSLLDFTKRKGSIADPWYTGNFDETYADVYEGCKALLCYLMNAKGEIIQ